jgi:hypothetical protein
MSFKLALLSSLPAVAFAACTPQVDGNYQGQTLATLSGSLTSTAAAATADADVSVVWGAYLGGLSLVGADTAAVTGAFPAAFQLSIFTPPTDDMLSDIDGVKYGVAYIVADAPGQATHTTTETWQGAEYDHVLVYLPATPPDGSAVAGFLHGTPSPGYHLYAVHRLTDTERTALFACITDLHNQVAEMGRMETTQEIYSTCGGLGEVDLHLADGDLDAPLTIDLTGHVDFNDLPQW